MMSQEIGNDKVITLKRKSLLFSVPGLLLALVTGCPEMGDMDNGNGDGNGTPGTTDASIVSFRSNFEVSRLEMPISVFYTVLTTGGSADPSIEAFMVEVEDDSPDAAELGEPFTIASNLPTGERQSFNFDPRNLFAGFYRIGIRVTLSDGQVEEAESEGVIQVQEPPDPQFIQPIQPVTEVTAGAEVFISFDAGDPEGVVQWRLFYLTSTDSRTDTPDMLGTQLQRGSGNVGNATFATQGLPPGDYELGIAATDSGFSVSSTVANGDLARIVTIPNEEESGPIIRIQEDRPAMPPTVVFQNPGAADIELFGDDVIDIEFAVSINEPGATGLVDVFYDTDMNSDNVTFPISTNLPDTTTSVAFDTSEIAAEGSYFIGVSVRDGINPNVVRYASGQVILVREGELTITEPLESVTFQPFTEGTPPQTVTVSWETNVPDGAGLVDVFARVLDENGEVGGPEIEILEPTALTTTSITLSNQFFTLPAGEYELFVRINFTDDTTEPLVARSTPATLEFPGNMP